MMTVLTDFGSDAERKQSVAHRLDHLAVALLPHRLVEAGIDDDRSGRPDDRPDEEIERLQHIVRIAADEIRRRAPFMVAVADGIDFMQVIAHGGPSPVLLEAS